MGHCESCSKGDEVAGKRETVLPEGSFVQRVSRADFGNWLGADTKVSFCLISLFCLVLSAVPLLCMCLWPFVQSKWDCISRRPFSLLCSTNSEPSGSVSCQFFLA